MTSRASSVAQSLLQIKAIKLSPQNPFTWASGIQSPIYCDNRLILSHPTIRSSIKRAFVAEAKTFGAFDTIAGVATAGVPHGALLADALKLPFVYVRNKPKEHGRKNLIEGQMDEGAKVLVIEDLISTGGSSISAVQAVREAGGEVVGVLAIFTYGFKAAEKAFAAANCPLKTLTNYGILINQAVKTNYIEQKDVQMLENWLITIDKANE